MSTYLLVALKDHKVFFGSRFQKTVIGRLLLYQNSPFIQASFVDKTFSTLYISKYLMRFLAGLQPLKFLRLC